MCYVVVLIPFFPSSSNELFFPFCLFPPGLFAVLSASAFSFFDVARQQAPDSNVRRLVLFAQHQFRSAPLQLKTDQECSPIFDIPPDVAACSLLPVSSFLFMHTHSLLLLLSRCAAHCVIGNMVTTEELANAKWLNALLFAGGMPGSQQDLVLALPPTTLPIDQVGYRELSSVFLALPANNAYTALFLSSGFFAVCSCLIHCSQLPLIPPPSTDDDDCRSILESIVENTGAGAILLKRFAPFDKARLPSSVKPLCDRAVRVAFACLLKHLNRWKLAIAEALPEEKAPATPSRPDDGGKQVAFAVPSSAGVPPNAILLKIFQSAISAIQHKVADLHARTGDASTFVCVVEKRGKFLLGLTSAVGSTSRLIALPDLPPVLPGLGRSVSKPWKLVRNVSIPLFCSFKRKLKSVSLSSFLALLSFRLRMLSTLRCLSSID